MTSLNALLQFSDQKKIPHILQTEVTECGLACIAMLAAFHGHHVGLSELRRQYSVSLKGTTLNDLIKIANNLKLDTRPVKADLDDLPELNIPCLLHWDMNHFVVLKSVKRKLVTIVDPAVGERTISMSEFGEHFTGVALEVSPTYNFEKKKPKKSLHASDLWRNIHGVKRLLTQVFLLSLAMQLLVVASPFYMQLILDDVIVSHDSSLLQTLAIGFVLVLMLNVLITFVRSSLILFLSNHLSFQFASNIFRHLIRLPMGYFEKRHMGDIVSRFGSNRAIKNFLAHGAVSVAIDALMTLTTLCMMLIYSPLLSAVVLTSVGIYVLGRVFLYSPFKYRTEESVIAAAKSDSNFMETVRGMQSIKIFGKENDRRALWQKRYTDLINTEIRLGKFRIGYDAFNNAIMGLENIIVIFIAASMVLNQHFSIGMMMAFITYKLQFTSKAFALVEQIIDFKMLDVHLTRLSDIVLTPPSNDGAVTHFSEPITQGQLSLKNLSYRHSENEPYLFKNIDLEIKEGKTIAIIGPSGCGKTTLLKVMLGLFTPDEGAININAVNIRDCGIDHYRSAVGAVMQDDQLLSGSIADNICFFDNKPDYTHIAHCAELAAINYDIEKMPMKYNSLVGDMGTTLSGGQKQRILLARALYRSPKILFLDEATSHLDTRLESVVNSNLKQKNITTIMIAHRPDTIRWADEVYMLENGNLCAVELPKNITKQHQTTLVANTNNC